MILAIESSCDDTSAAIVDDGNVLSTIVSSQEGHVEWGGIVPELASRAHLRSIVPIISLALERAEVTMNDIDAIAVTTKPGLIGSLLVGLNAAKGISIALGKPIIGVNHIEAHLLSVMLENEVEFPFLSLVVSGGHTILFDVQQPGDYLMLGATRDDAAGEAFDKGAKLLGLPYPGGPLIDKLAKDGNPKAHDFPRSLADKPSFDFSFSGLKTSLRYFIRDNYQGILPKGQELADVAASYQEAIVDALLLKSFRAAKEHGRTTIAIVGGVAANSRLRSKFEERGKREGVRVITTSPLYSTDNAAMIGLVGSLRYRAGNVDSIDMVAEPSLREVKRIKGARGKGKSTETYTMKTSTRRINEA